ncbi:hypothetical protein [Streptomyces sp. enrichment culture]|uniref:hypothetical protein n=1 Tax=Streptomyces sp. enrichment culture TaxID=1795815 RepID=UPI003F576478
MNPYSDTLTPAQDVWPMCDPYTSTLDLGHPAAPERQDDYLLPPPDPKQRLDIPVSAADHRRLELYAALTVRGIAPLPGDQYAVTAISSLGDAVTGAVLRWMSHPAG